MLKYLTKEPQNTKNVKFESVHSIKVKKVYIYQDPEIDHSIWKL